HGGAILAELGGQGVLAGTGAEEDELWGIAAQST
nr:hypothetical protein [Tanacetum cinerariifolium]